ncbi:MAG: Regulator of chromosome condensation [Sclerophora amabilis]|nr:MAG: Regulator of chromosome condensation [Sclerophora amabilis]
MPPKKSGPAKAAPKKTTQAQKAPTKGAAKNAPQGANKATAKVTKSNVAAAPKTEAKAPAKGRGRSKGSAQETNTANKAGSSKADATAGPSSNGNQPNKGVKRKSRDDDEKAPTPPGKKQRPTPKVGYAPNKRLNVYVFGEGSAGELGLGTAKRAVDVKRPRLNPNLPADTVGVVQVAVGGMHCVALTHDNKILSWGVNDSGALGRDTAWDGGFKEVDKNDDDSDSDSDSDADSGINPKEANPAAVEGLPGDVTFVQVAAGDSCSFALTETGQVYGWGTFRGVNGIMGFRKEDVSWTVAEINEQPDPKLRRPLVYTRPRPLLIEELKKIKEIKCGSNHVLALDKDGNVFAWGAGEQYQLGRKLVERHVVNGLVPREFGLPHKKITTIGCGSDHSLAIDKNGNVWSWGLNAFGETGIREGFAEKEDFIMRPTKVKSLKDRNIVHAVGGSHHSVAVDEDGHCLVWGRVDGNQLGLDTTTMGDEDFVLDARDTRRILKKPSRVPGFLASMASASNDTSIAITRDGRAYSWGFSISYQTGQGTSEDVKLATLIDNTAVRNKKLNWAGVGGQFGVLTAPAGPDGDREPAPQ